MSEGHNTSGIAKEASAPLIAKALEQVAKVVALVGALCYATGLFVTNSYLQSLGIADFSALRIRFLYSGSVALSFIGFLAIFVAVGSGILARSVRSLKNAVRFSRSWWRACSLVIGGAFIFLAPVSSIAISASHSSLRVRIAVGLEAQVLILGIWYFSHFLITAIRQGLLEADDRDVVLIGASPYKRSIFLEALGWQKGAGSPTFSTLVLPVLYLFMLPCFLLIAYSETAFPQIPEQFGGAKPKTIRLALQRETEAKLQQIGVNVDASLGLSEPLELLYESEEWIVVRCGKNIVSIHTKDVIVKAVTPHPLHKGWFDRWTSALAPQ